MRLRLAPYPAYKDSGEPWLGEVPAHWDAWRLKRIARLAYGTSLASDARVAGRVTVYGSNGRVGLHDAANTRGPCIIIGRKGSFGKVNYSTEPAFAIDTTFFIDQGLTGDSLRWLFHVLGSARLDDSSRDSAIPGLDRDAAYERIIPRPSVIEQRQIAAFLDYADRRINRLIRAKRALIELLNEQKQAIIHHAVTRGLDPNVRLKPSGIDWLGDVPEHWDVQRLKRMVRATGGMTPSKAEPSFWIGDMPWVSPKDMKTPTIRDSVDHISLDAIAKTGITVVEPRSVLIVVRGMILARTFPCAVSEVPLTVNQDMKALQVNPEMLTGRFLQYLLTGLQSHILSAMVEEAGHGTRCLRTDVWGDMPLAIPSVPEQISITQHLDSELKQLTRTLSSAAKQVDLLREYRTRLIADVVTGKLDVRGVELPPLDDDGALDEIDAADDVAADADVIDDGGEDSDGAN